MIDKKYIEIKEEVLQHAMELWGIKDVRRLDPVVDLLLDVFAYETSRLHQEIKLSDSRILHRLARILISNKWSLPIPAHALMTVYPSPEETCLLTPEDHFYTERIYFGRPDGQLFFTPLATHRLVDARIRCRLYDTELFYKHNRASLRTAVLSKKDKVQDFCFWIGIEIGSNQLDALNELTLCVLTRNKETLPFLRMLEIYDADKNRLSTSPTTFFADSVDEAHYFEEIKNYYRDLYHTVTIPVGEAKKRRTLRELFPAAISDDDVCSENLFWLQLKLPEIFTKEYLDQLEIYINTYPVVNRRLIYRQHDFSSNGKIMPLPNLQDSYFLNIHSMSDNHGNVYTNVTKCFEEDLSGTFSLYFGDIERFNSDTARALITKVLQLIREDGNAFAALNPDTINSGLKDLFLRINELEKSIDNASHQDSQERAFLLTAPKAGATHYETKYWLTNGEMANGLDERAFIQQFSSEKFDAAAGMKFRTITQGGRIRKDEQQLINSLRYGLLTKDRIVSKEDIKSYIKKQLGEHIQTITVKDGVAVASEPKKGLVRTTDIIIELTETLPDKKRDLSLLSHFFEQELTQKSISNSFYKVIFK